MVSLAQRFQPVGFPEDYRPEAQPLAPRVALSFQIDRIPKICYLAMAQIMFAHDLCDSHIGKNSSFF
jgi:hypothetical protein